MNVSDAYTWKMHGCKRDNNPLLPSNIRGFIIGKSNFGKTTLLLNLLLQPHWLDYNHLYVFGKSLHQQEYQIVKIGYEAGLSKSQVANIFHSQKVLAKVQLSSLEAIEEYTGLKEGGAQMPTFMAIVQQFLILQNWMWWKKVC